MIPHEEPSTLCIHHTTFSLFVHQPASGMIEGDRPNVELVFVRHNLEADTMFASSWMIHKLMNESVIESSVEELTQTWVKA
jgi:hypothetical protein